MQALKNMAGTVKHKVEDGAATIEAKTDVAKAEVEKVEKLRADDDASKEEATKEKTEKEEVTEKTEDRKTHHERQNPIGECPTPADLNMSVENPTQPAMNTGMSATVFPQTVAAPAFPFTSKHFIRK